MVYQLQRPSIEMIIDYCRDLLADEKLEVYEFGQNYCGQNRQDSLP